VTANGCLPDVIEHSRGCPAPQAAGTDAGAAWAQPLATISQSQKRPVRRPFYRSSERTARGGKTTAGHYTAGSAGARVPAVES